MKCQLVAKVLSEIIPGLRGIVEVVARKSFVEACEENLFREIIERYYGKEGVEVIIRVIEARIELFRPAAPIL